MKSKKPDWVQDLEEAGIPPELILEQEAKASMPLVNADDPKVVSIFKLKPGRHRA
jgi:hypothetical protein